MSQNPNLFLSIGKPVKDDYGRAIGKVASFAITPSGKFDAVFVEQGDGKFMKHSMEHLKFNGAEVTLTSKIKSDAGSFADQIPLIWRKDQALKELSDKKKISPDIYNELHNSFEGVLAQLKSEAQTLSQDVEKEAQRIAGEIRELNYALVNLEIEHEIGKVDAENYEKAFTIIQDNLKRAHEEKNDLEFTKSKISNILLGDKSQPSPEKVIAKQPVKSSSSSYSSTDLPEPPVVVYVKEIGRTGV